MLFIQILGWNYRKDSTGVSSKTQPHNTESAYRGAEMQSSEGCGKFKLHLHQLVHLQIEFTYPFFMEGISFFSRLMASTIPAPDKKTANIIRRISPSISWAALFAVVKMAAPPMKAKMARTNSMILIILSFDLNKGGKPWTCDMTFSSFSDSFRRDLSLLAFCDNLLWTCEIAE